MAPSYTPSTCYVSLCMATIVLLFNFSDYTTNVSYSFHFQHLPFIRRRELDSLLVYVTFYLSIQKLSYLNCVIGQPICPDLHYLLSVYVKQLLEQNT